MRARLLLRPVRTAICASLATLQACAFPTDDSETVSVRIDALSTTVIRGESLVLTARALRGGAGTGPQPAQTTFAWSSDDESIATVSGGEDGIATVHGINSGRVTIRAIARDYRNADAGVRSIRVSNTVAIDSVVPDTVRYGEQVTVYGVGLGRVDQVILSETALLPDPEGALGDPLGEGSARYWVPYPARSARAIAIAFEGFSAPAAATTVVVPASAYTLADGSATSIDLDGAPLSDDGTLFYNPALALTAGVGVNVLHLARSDTTGPLTIVISTSDPVVSDFNPTLSLPGDFSADSFAYFGWRVGASEQLCQRIHLVTAPGLDIGGSPVTIARTLQHTFRGGIDLRIFGASPGRYSLRILDGYLPVDPRIGPDRFEENDFCNGADVNAEDPTRRLDAAAGINEVLSIDQPFDVDWLRFTLPEGPAGTQLVTIRTASLPFAAADSSNVGLGLEARDDLLFSSEEKWTAQSHTPGSSEQISLELSAGDYYIVVADEAGVPTRYALCAAIGNDCPLPSAPSAVRAGNLRARPAGSRRPDQ